MDAFTRSYYVDGAKGVREQREPYILAGMFRHLVDSVCRYLDVGGPPERADCIFVFAGRPERKKYGLHLFRRSLAERIVFSVGRYEWRRFPELGLDDDGDLRALAESIPPSNRHFFVELRQSTVTCSHVTKGRLGTLGEAAALSRYLDWAEVRSLLIVSSRLHLRRAADAVKHYTAHWEPRVISTGVPSEWEAGAESRGEVLPTSGRLVFREYAKYVLYQILLLFS